MSAALFILYPLLGFSECEGRLTLHPSHSTTIKTSLRYKISRMTTEQNAHKRGHPPLACACAGQQSTAEDCVVIDGLINIVLLPTDGAILSRYDDKPVSHLRRSTSRAAPTTTKTTKTKMPHTARSNHKCCRTQGCGKHIGAEVKKYVAESCHASPVITHHSPALFLTGRSKRSACTEAHPAFRRTLATAPEHPADCSVASLAVISSLLSTLAVRLAWVRTAVLAGQTLAAAALLPLV